jgi:hypothetical protein
MTITYNSPIVEQVAELHRLADEAARKSSDLKIEAYRMESLAIRLHSDAFTLEAEGE